MTEAEVFSLPLNQYMAYRRQRAQRLFKLVNFDYACVATSEAIWLRQYYEYKVSTLTNQPS